MRPFSPLSCFFLIIRLSVPALAADGEVDLYDVWKVAEGTSNGGCDNRKNVLEKWNDESGELASNAVNSLAAYSTDEVVRAAVQSFFNLRPKKAGGLEPANTEKFAELQENFDTILRFFDGNWPGGTEERVLPALYCDSTWPEKVDLGLAATARDNTGKEIWINNVPQTIGKLYGGAITGGQVPYWSDLVKHYDFSTEADAGRYCANNPTSKGATSDLRTTANGVYDPEKDPLSVVTLCPYAFTDSDDIETLPQDEGSMVDSDGDVITDGTHLSKVLPRSSTLLHEAFHVVFGRGFASGENELYAVSECIALTQGDSLINPENYVLFAVAMWYREKGNWNFSKGSAVKRST